MMPLARHLRHVHVTVTHEVHVAGPATLSVLGEREFTPSRFGGGGCGSGGSHFLNHELDCGWKKSAKCARYARRQHAKKMRCLDSAATAKRAHGCNTLLWDKHSRLRDD